jgi:hypothetical protein
MKQFIKKAMFGLSLVLLGTSLWGAPVFAETAKDSVCQGVGVVTGNGCAERSGDPTINSVTSTVVNLLSVVVGIVAVIMLIIGGLKYILSSGDSANITSAKNTILYAIIGLVVVAFAQFIVKFVLAKVT